MENQELEVQIEVLEAEEREQYKIVMELRGRLAAEEFKLACILQDLLKALGKKVLNKATKN